MYAAADLIVCRGGAGTLTELGVVGRPSIVIPASIAADDHQAVNAWQIENLGAGKILYEKARWKDGKIDGEGTFSWSYGNKYAGEWKNGKIRGQGTYTWSDGNKYVGEWNYGKSHGHGVFLWSDGESFIHASG